MDDSTYGTKDKRGNFTPKDPLEIAPIWRLPPRPLAVLKWLPEYLFGWNLFLFAAAAAIWFLLTPQLATMAELKPGWIAWIWVRNMGLVTALFGVFHLRLYIRRAQGSMFKYNAKFPETSGQKGFLFGSQTRENLFWTYCSGVPIWTAYEVAGLHLYATGWMPWLSFAEHPVGFIALLLLIPLWRELHFYCIHRLIHWGPFYHWIHKLHHNNVNPGPWSSLSMHPVEHVLYFSVSLLHFIVPSHPLHFLYTLHHAALGAIVGHIGFDKIVTGEENVIDTHAYAHYLHHKFFEVNYGDGSVPLDQLFGTFHDGTPEGDARMEARRRARMANN